MPRLLEARPYLASINANHLWRDKADHVKKKSWQFRVDLAYVGELTLSTGRKEVSRSTALSATNHAGLGMTLEVTLVDPVPSGVAIRRARLTRRGCLMFRFVCLWPAFREIVSEE